MFYEFTTLRDEKVCVNLDNVLEVTRSIKGVVTLFLADCTPISVVPTDYQAFIDFLRGNDKIKNNV